VTGTASNETGELRELYRELILDHARSPRHFGRLEPATHRASGINPLCGDKLELYLQVEGDRIRAAAFEGSGCAISVASASLLTETVTGLTTADATACSHRLTASLTADGSAGDADDAEYPGKLGALGGVREFPSRVKCATLAWRALDAALDGNHTPATTE
jgi:nitrogen fixation NifU-like protein